MVTRLFGCDTFHKDGGYKRSTSHYRGDFDVGWRTHKKRRNVKMFHIRKIQSTAFASAVLCCFAAALQGAAPDVHYHAAGVFATPAVSGMDVFRLAGEPFDLNFVINEATEPARHSETMAEYTNVTVKFKVES